MEEEQFNTFCVNPECLQKRDCFFKWISTNHHVANRHPIKMIHPLQFNNLFLGSSQTQDSCLEKDKNSLLGKLNDYITQFCDRVAAFLKEKYLNAFIKSAKSQMDNMKFGDPNDICDRLKQGDYDILKEVISFGENSTHRYPFQELFEKKMTEIDQKVKGQLNELFEAFDKIIAVTFLKKQDFLKIARGEMESLSQQNKKQIQQVLKINENGEEAQINIENSRTPSSSSPVDYANSNQENSRKQQWKTKLIKKTKSPKKPRPTVQNSQNKQKSQKQSSSQKWKACIKPIGADSVIILECSKSAASSIFEWLKANKKDLKGLHIFGHQFATKQYLLKIFQTFKGLTNVSLNCNHEFDRSILLEYPSQSLQKIQNLELKWYLMSFFKESQIFKYFPIKAKENIQRTSQMSIPRFLLEQMKENRSLLINNDKQIEELKAGEGFNFQKIRTLHCARAHGPSIMPALNLTKLSTFTQTRYHLTNLTALSLTEIYFGDSQLQFKQLLRLNPGIKCLNLSYCTIKQKSIGYILDSLKQLPYLSKFSYAPGGGISKSQVHPDLITCLTNLEELYLDNINFIGKTQENSSSHLKNFSALTKLTCLSLYSCKPMFSDFLSCLDPKVLANLQFLTLGAAEINNDFFKYFPEMKKLEFLNIDQVEVTGFGFVQACREFLKKNECFPPLRYLSLQEIENKQIYKREWSFTVEEMKDMGKCLPHLEYLQIMNCNNLEGYNFAEFLSLKTLAVSKKMSEKIKPSSSSVKLFVDQS